MRTFIIFLVLLGLTQPLVHAQSLKDGVRDLARQLRASELRFKDRRQILLEGTNFYSQQKDSHTQAIEQELFQILTETFPTHQFLLKDESLTGRVFYASSNKRNSYPVGETAGRRKRCAEVTERNSGSDDHIRGYVTAELSIGEAAELLGLPYEEARHWFHQKGIATLRKLEPKLQELLDQKRIQLAQELDIDSAV